MKTKWEKSKEIEKTWKRTMTRTRKIETKMMRTTILKSQGCINSD